MSGWPILDVAIGLSFIYLLLSTICSTITEGITTQLRSRSKYLERGIASLLGDKPEAKEEFYAHPLIQTFSNGPGDSVFRKLTRKVKKKTEVRADQRPSYLPGDKFAAVILQMKDAVDKDGKTVYPELQKIVNQVAGAATGKGTAEQIEAVQLWYDQVMERVSGWYKRHAQAWVRFLAVVVVIVLNADTLHIGNLLWSDPTVRQMAVEQAKVRVRQPAPETAAIEYSDTDETLPDEPPAEIGKSGDSSDKYYGLTGEQWELLQKVVGWDEDYGELKQRLQDVQARNAEAKLAKEEASKQGQSAPPQAEITSEMGVYFGWFGYLLQRHLLGWLLSMVAVSLGSPFWYGLLNRLVNIRNAGQAPATEAPGKEKKE
jgi:hypothetical protein